MVQLSFRNMGEDQEVTETGVSKPKKPRVSEHLFAARKRMAQGTGSSAETATEPRHIARFETGAPAQVDYKVIDQVDSLLVGEAEEIQAELLQNPNHPNAEKLREQVDVLSSGVGREHSGQKDIKARLFGVGFLLQRNAGDLPEEIGKYVRMIELSRDGEGYTQGKNGLDAALGNMASEQRRNVEVVLHKRKTLNLHLDHLDGALSGEVSFQERAMGFIERASGAGPIDGTLKRMIGNEIERRLGFGVVGFRPREVHSTARLAMEKEGADPLLMMSVQVAEARQELEADVSSRLQEEWEDAVSGEPGKAPVPEAEAPQPAAETAEVTPGQEARPRTKKEELEARLVQLDQDMNDSAVAEDEWDRWERLGKERGRVADQLKALEAEAARAQAPAPTEKAEVPKARAEAPKAAAEAEKRELTHEEKRLQSGLLEFVGKSYSEIQEKLEKVTSGEMSIQDLAAEIAGKDRGVRKVFYNVFREELKRRGIPEDTLKSATDEQLREALNKALDAGIDKKIKGEKRKSLRTMYLLYFLMNMWDELKKIPKEFEKQAAEALKPAE